MKIKKNYVILTLLILIFLIIVTGLVLRVSSGNSEIPNDYIAIFNGEIGKTTYSTYVYKINNGQANYGFKYINTVNTTVSLESSQYSKVIKKGKVEWTEDILTVAKENNAYSYVKLPNDDTKYSVEEFAEMFLMDSSM